MTTMITECKMNIKGRTTGEASFPRAKTLDMVHMITEADIEDPVMFLIMIVTIQWTKAARHSRLRVPGVGVRLS